MLHKGYTLLFAVLLSSMVLAISVSVLNIARKEIILSSGARESAAAIYIADGAIDCAVFHDQNSQFNTSSTHVPVTCGGIDRDVGVTTGTVAGIAFTRYTFYVSDNINITSPCAAVTVDRYVAGPDPVVTPAKTIIEARGYNLGYDAGTGTCGARHPRKVERAFRYSYTM
jgi:hypothetical protein